ncbi:hypothetical protein GCM10027347_13370 [Larkinella harenae]
MNDPNDDLLHTWVRQTLDPYRPAYDPDDWNRLRQTLRRQRFKRWTRALLLFLLVGGVAAWWLWPSRANKTRPLAVKNLPSQTIGAQPEKQTISLEEPLKTSSSNPFKKAIRRLHQTVDASPDGLSSPAFEAATIPLRFSRQTGARLQPPVIPPIRVFSPQETVLRRQLLDQAFGPDSTSYQTLTRNITRWPHSVLVCDFTSSMHPYSTQVFAWMQQHAHSPALQGMVFFTDCDSLGQETRAGGPAGRMFITSEREPINALPVLLDAAQNTANNSDEAENDVEALLIAQKRFPTAQHLILLADMDNPVKDMYRLDQVQKPVHIILCGRDWDSTQAFHPDYYTIARRTNGTIHTLKDDIDLAHLQPGTRLRIGPYQYRYHRGKGRFVLNRSRQRPGRVRH